MIFYVQISQIYLIHLYSKIYSPFIFLTGMGGLRLKHFHFYKNR